MRESFFLVRLVKRGPWLPARMWWCDGEPDADGELTTDEGWRAEVAGERYDFEALSWAMRRAFDPAFDPSDMPLKDVPAQVKRMPVPHGYTPAQEYEYRCRVISHARAYRPKSPEANPSRRVDLGKAPPVF